MIIVNEIDLSKEQRRTWALSEGLSPDAIEKMYRDLANHFIKEEMIHVFEHVAIYVGMRGVEMVPGPNAVLEGDPSSVSASITKKYQITFIKNNNGYISELEKHVKLIVVPHPKINNASIVIGGYFGP